ncbi:MAG TPA: serine/threonine-protein kinase [Gemmataceae bacterium]|nr:serine/threonine-protein kinase [Gemmataceae bacterium]
MASTTSYHPHQPAPLDRTDPAAEGLLARYAAIADAAALDRDARVRLIRPIGAGGQGVVYLGERRGADGFMLPVTLKAFSPEPYRDADAYEEDMARVAQVAARVARIQHDNLLSIHDFFASGGIRIMEMEWLDGHDLRVLLTPETLERTRARVGAARWEYVQRVVLTHGATQPRFQPGVAIRVLRDCLSGLAALHRRGIVHGDLKPSNVMLKRTGNVKLIDIGSAVQLNRPTARRVWSPAYAAPEVLAGEEATPRSDLASLGYVLVEMLAGRSPFEGLKTVEELRSAKAGLDRRLPELLPPEVSRSELLLHLCRRLVAADPAKRFPDELAADLGRKGAADFHRQLVKGDLASEYENDLRVWLEQLGSVP